MPQSGTARREELGIDLPPVAAPVASYIPASRVGNQVWTSGQLPLVSGELTAAGHVGAEVSSEEAVAAARTAFLNALAAVDSVAGLNSIERIVKITGFVNSASGFTAQPAVVNGASDLAGEIFGDAGEHVRSAVGVAELPKNAPVEVELIVEVSD